MDTYIETLDSTYMAGLEEDYNDTLEESIYSAEESDDWGYLSDEAETDDEFALDEENEFEAFEMDDDFNFGREEYISNEPTEYELDEWEESLEDAETLREVLHEDYADSPSEEMEEALENILNSISLEEGWNIKKILRDVRKNKTVGQVLQQGLPLAGATVGTIYGGPLGTALGGAAGNYAAQAFTVKPKGTKRPSGPKNITRPSSSAVHPKKTSPNGGSTAAAKLLQLTQNPDVLKSLLALSLGKHGKQEIKTDKSGKNVKVGAVMNLLSTLLSEAVDDADELARTGVQSSYLYDREGEFLVDPASLEQRAGLLYESINGPDYVNYTNVHKESEEFYPTSSESDNRYQEGAVAAAGLGIAVFQTGVSIFSGGSFKTSSTPANYTHKKTPPHEPLDRLTVKFKLNAFHPRRGLSDPNFWFKLNFEYNGFDIKAASITPLRSKSSTLIKSNFSITFSPTAYSAPADTVAKIRFLVSGNWDPTGSGDVSFDGYVDITAKGGFSFKINSEKNWVEFKGYYNPKWIRIKNPSKPRPIVRRILNHTVYFSPSGSSRVSDKSIQQLRYWLKNIGTNPQAFINRLKAGAEPIQLDGFASTTASISKNQRLARKRAENVQHILRDFVGYNAKINIEIHGELDANTANNVEDSKERKVEIKILD